MIYRAKGLHSHVFYRVSGSGVHELRQEGLDARGELSRLLLGELVEEAGATDQAVLIRGPVEVVVYNEISDRVSILIHQLIKDMKESLLMLAVL